MDDIENNLQKYKDLMEGLARKMPQIVLAYIFGSTATNRRGPMSDYDFAVYLNEPDKKKRYDIKFQLMGELSNALKTNKVDVAVINDTDNINLKYAIISESKVIFEKEPHKIIVESRILNEYFDFRIFIDTYQKTK
ncbi:MAG: nucleotidyltransferase domain-containing protein [Candidatus Nealsonbacteria bacterium DGGOD1a]|jgi:Nucleotidyltransferase domain.|nr:MAG: nucleotidyltransferase domain-containing protein [Candidatus Nealsonbacteria bacterium DGGOD1a]